MKALLPGPAIGAISLVCFAVLVVIGVTLMTVFIRRHSSDLISCSTTADCLSNDAPVCGTRCMLPGQKGDGKVCMKVDATSAGQEGSLCATAADCFTNEAPQCLYGSCSDKSTTLGFCAALEGVAGNLCRQDGECASGYTCNLGGVTNVTCPSGVACLQPVGRCSLVSAGGLGASCSTNNDCTTAEAPFCAQSATGPDGDLKCAPAASNAMPRIRVTNNCPFDVWIQNSDPWNSDSLYDTMQRNQSVTDELVAYNQHAGSLSASTENLDDTARTYNQAFENLNATNNTHLLRGTQVNVDQVDRQWAFYYPEQPDWWTHSSCPGSDRSSMHPTSEVCLRATGAGGVCTTTGDYTNMNGSMAPCSPTTPCISSGESCNYGVRTCGRGGSLCSLNLSSETAVCGTCCDASSGECTATSCAKDTDCVDASYAMCVSKRSECVPLSPPCYSLETTATPDDTYAFCCDDACGCSMTTTCTFLTSGSGDGSGGGGDDAASTCASGNRCSYPAGYCFTPPLSNEIISPFHGAVCASSDDCGANGRCVTNSLCETADSACSPACGTCSAFSYTCDANDYLGDLRLTTKIGCGPDDPAGVDCVLGNAAGGCTEWCQGDDDTNCMTICQPEATTAFGFNISSTSSTLGMNLANAATIPAAVVPVVGTQSTATAWKRCQSSQPGCATTPETWCPRYDPLYDCIGTCGGDPEKPAADKNACDDPSAPFETACTEVKAECVLRPGSDDDVVVGFCNDADRTPCTSDGSGGGDNTPCGPRVMDLRILAGDLAAGSDARTPVCNPPESDSAWPVFSAWTKTNCLSDDGCRVCGETSEITPCFDSNDCPSVCRHKITGVPNLTVCQTDADCGSSDFACSRGSCIAAPCGGGDGDDPVTGCMSPCTKLNAKTSGLSRATTPSNATNIPFGYDQATVDCGPKCSKCNACTGICKGGPRAGVQCFSSDECLEGGSCELDPSANGGSTSDGACEGACACTGTCNTTAGMRETQCLYTGRGRCSFHTNQNCMNDNDCPALESCDAIGHCDGYPGVPCVGDLQCRQPATYQTHNACVNSGDDGSGTKTCRATGEACVSDAGCMPICTGGDDCTKDCYTASECLENPVCHNGFCVGGFGFASGVSCNSDTDCLQISGVKAQCLGTEACASFGSACASDDQCTSPGSKCERCTETRVQHNSLGNEYYTSCDACVAFSECRYGSDKAMDLGLVGKCAGNGQQTCLSSDDCGDNDCIFPGSGTPCTTSTDCAYVTTQSHDQCLGYDDVPSTCSITTTMTCEASSDCPSMCLAESADGTTTVVTSLPAGSDGTCNSSTCGGIWPATICYDDSDCDNAQACVPLTKSAPEACTPANVCLSDWRYGVTSDGVLQGSEVLGSSLTPCGTSTDGDTKCPFYDSSSMYGYCAWNPALFGDDDDAIRFRYYYDEVGKVVRRMSCAECATTPGIDGSSFICSPPPSSTGMCSNFCLGLFDEDSAFEECQSVVGDDGLGASWSIAGLYCCPEEGYIPADTPGTCSDGGILENSYHCIKSAQDDLFGTCSSSPGNNKDAEKDPSRAFSYGLCVTNDNSRFLGTMCYLDPGSEVSNLYPDIKLNCGSGAHCTTMSKGSTASSVCRSDADCNECLISGDCESGYLGQCASIKDQSLSGQVCAPFLYGTCSSGYTCVQTTTCDRQFPTTDALCANGGLAKYSKYKEGIQNSAKCNASISTFQESFEPSCGEDGFCPNGTPCASGACGERYPCQGSSDAPTQFCSDGLTVCDSDEDCPFETALRDNTTCPPTDTRYELVLCPDKDAGYLGKSCYEGDDEDGDTINCFTENMDDVSSYSIIVSSI